MNYSPIQRALRLFIVVALLAGVSATGLSGCDGISVPIPVAISISTGTQIVASEQDDGSVDVPITVFCDLFSPEDLDALISTFAGQEISDLVDITAVTLESVEIMATAGNFNDFTMGSFDMTPIGGDSPTTDFGAVTNAGGLGTSFELVQDEPIDLLNDLQQDQCGVATLHLDGDTPAENITFNVVANVLVYTRISFGQ